jgi:hypothetical protein
MQSDLVVEVENDHIVVAPPGTSFRALYTKSGQREQAKLVQLPMALFDSSASAGPSEFEKTAWEAANAKARELGWIE